MSMAKNSLCLFEQCVHLVDIRNASLFIPGEKQRKLVLHDINLQLSQSSHYILMGANGSGKSTLLRLIHGDLWLSSGSISWLDGSVMSSSPIVAKSITALVSSIEQDNFQRHSAQINVENFLVHSLPINKGSEYKDTRQKICQMLADLESENILHIPLSWLSQGQLRLAILAKAILFKPRLLLLDEYTDGLDDKHKELVFKLLSSISSHTAMIFATHRKDGAPGWANKIFYMVDGRLCSERPQEIGIKNKKYENISPLAIYSSDKNEKSACPPKKIISSRLLLNIENASVYVERQCILKGINWHMIEGENWAITGENGAGKSTFLRMISGDEFVAAGGYLHLYDLHSGVRLQSLQEMRQKIRLVSDFNQSRYDYPLSALELVLSGFDYSVGLYREFTEEEMKEAYDILKLFFPDCDIAHVSIRRLSAGQLRKLFLARALMGSPQLILLDEACTGLDNKSRTEFLRLVDVLASSGYKEQPVHFIIASHYAEDFPSCINRHLHMSNGSIKSVEKIK